MPMDGASNAELVYDPRRYRKWLWGWLSYAFASYVHRTRTRDGISLLWLDREVFVIVSLTLFLPICLEQFARCTRAFSPLCRG